MQEQPKIQQIPVKVYRTDDRLMVAAPMPGLEPSDILVEVTEDDYMVMQGELRGLLKNVKDLLVDEWSVGSYYRELALPVSVDAQRANMNYGNGVLVLAFPISDHTVAARLTMDTVGSARGERIGNAGHDFSSSTDLT
jgi:HSP20 family protein